MRVYLNAFRRWLVKRLLGDGLALEKRETPNGTELQLIDTNRRINYGFWSVETCQWHEGLFKLMWLPAFGLKNPSQNPYGQHEQ